VSVDEKVDEIDMRAALQALSRRLRGSSRPPVNRNTWLGKNGSAFSPLHPAAIVMIDGQRVDVVSDGEFIDAGIPIVVTRVDGNRIVVRRSRTPTEGSLT
jgi:membrane-bound serine protease (ClpP class)